jgi:hypothetical protein
MPVGINTPETGVPMKATHLHTFPDAELAKERLDTGMQGLTRQLACSMADFYQAGRKSARAG